jgi:hypothetical protein
MPCSAKSSGQARRPERRQWDAGRGPSGTRGDGGRGVESHTVFETFQGDPEVLGATGQQIVVGHRTGAFVEVDFGSHRGGDILRQLVDAVG